jgi:hypothetical protein
MFNKMYYNVIGAMKLTAFQLRLPFKVVASERYVD